MLRRCLAIFLRTAGILALSGALASAYAVELGDMAVRSHIGQPLVADIELTGFAEGATVDVRLAHPDVFKGANLAMHAVLPTMRMAVTRRDGGQFVRITTAAPVQTQYVHLFLDLGEGGRRNVRQASLPLTPDPRPAPPPAQLPLAAVSAPAPAPKPVAPVVIKPFVKPPVAPAPAAAPAASCPKPRYSDEEVRACATRDYQNAMLSAQIVELEEKVKALQAALDAPALAGAPVLQKAAAAAPAKRVPPPIRTVPRKNDKPAPVEEDGLPWLWIGAGLAALTAVAAALLVMVKRRKKVGVAAPLRPKSNMLGRLRDAMHRDKRPGERVEPVDDAPEKVAT